MIDGCLFLLSTNIFITCGQMETLTRPCLLGMGGKRNSLALTSLAHSRDLPLQVLPLSQLCPKPEKEQGSCPRFGAFFIGSEYFGISNWSLHLTRRPETLSGPLTRRDELCLLLTSCYKSLEDAGRNM
jgi:hypothetical protein